MMRRSSLCVCCNKKSLIKNSAGILTCSTSKLFFQAEHRDRDTGREKEEDDARARIMRSGRWHNKLSLCKQTKKKRDVRVRTNWDLLKQKRADSRVFLLG